ncbi:MAG: MATE family efflux transporter [Atopococcus tabaci]|uniref:Multidrug export protein MepA n=1 Tax=Atopococcus tabaci TaxID=269774 RepID=A0AA43ZRV6_9LACT|nr:MATE family efflux transporter [Atopococcus tabaci]
MAKLQSTQSLFFKYVSLAVLSMAGQSLFILADTFFIALGVGAEGIAALNIVLPIVNIVTGLGWMFGVGGSTLFTIEQSTGKTNKSRKTFSFTFLVTLLFGVLLALIFSIFKQPILSFLGSTPQLHAMSSAYFTVYTAFTPVFMLSFMMICFLRNDHSPRLATVALLSGGLLNIILDYIFIFPLGWGLAGAALATCMSPILSLLICSFHFRKKERQLRWQSPKGQMKQLQPILSNGFSSFMNEFSSALVMFVFNRVILSMVGTIGVSAYAIIANMNIIVIAILTGIGQGFQPLISEFYGTKQKKEGQETFRLGLWVYLLIGFLFALIGIIFPQEMVGIFNSQNNIQLTELAVPGLTLYFTSFIFTGFNFFVIYYAAAVNDGRLSMLISLLRGLILILPVLLIMSQWRDLQGVWLTMTAVELLTALISFRFVLYYRKSFQKITN